MVTLLWLVIGLACVSANPVESEEPEITPQQLNKLLREEKYEEFAALMRVPVSLVKERDTGGREELSRDEAMFNKELEGGDYMFDREETEMGRQAIDFSRFSGNKWPANRDGVHEIPYEIADHFSERSENIIRAAIQRWNDYLGRCVRLIPHSNQRNYVYVHNGNGCWSYIGRVNRRPQDLSLQQNGCVNNGTILHEFQHAAGFTHEHNRHDRDKNVEVLWSNIPDDWKKQYEKANNNYVDVGRYEYYSIMHYRMNAPGTNRKAFNMLGKDLDGRDVNERRVGNGNDFTREDLRKIREHYGCRA